MLLSDIMESFEALLPLCRKQINEDPDPTSIYRSILLDYFTLTCDLIIPAGDELISEQLTQCFIHSFIHSFSRRWRCGQHPSSWIPQPGIRVQRRESRPAASLDHASHPAVVPRIGSPRSHAVLLRIAVLSNELRRCGLPVLPGVFEASA